MFSLSPATRIFVALNPVDMRAGFNTFYSYVQTILSQDPLSGHLFCFTNRLRNRIRVLYWDGSGLWLCAKGQVSYCTSSRLYGISSGYRLRSLSRLPGCAHGTSPSGGSNRIRPCMLSSDRIACSIPCRANDIAVERWIPNWFAICVAVSQPASRR